MTVPPVPPLPPPPPAPSPLDVGSLADASRPKPVFRHAGRVIVFAVVAMFLVVLLPVSLGTKAIVQVLAWGTILAGAGFVWNLSRSLRDEGRQLDTIEDLLSLKRPGDALPRLVFLLSSPMRSAQGRLRALMLLAATMGRTQRYDEVLAIDEQLLVGEGLVGGAGTVVKLGRALAMLHADRLYDADRAINDLRRSIDRNPDHANDTLAWAALRLIELYRDVKTGHDAEAVELFQSHRDRITLGLGHRAGEAHALVAIAHHRLGQADAARAAMASATTLQGVGDLVRTYPELRPLLSLYPPAPAPARS
jgi:hypothetical protein